MRLADACRGIPEKNLETVVPTGYGQLAMAPSEKTNASATVREWLDVTPAGANNLVARLEGIGLLREITGYARNRRFRFDPYLRLFEDDREQGA